VQRMLRRRDGTKTKLGHLRQLRKGQSGERLSRGRRRNGFERREGGYPEEREESARGEGVGPEGEIQFGRDSPPSQTRDRL